MPQLSDEELVARYRTGSLGQSDPHINELFRRHYQRVACWCLRFAGNRDRALDLAQEVFAQAFRRLDSFQGNSKFSTWLYVITKNHCLNSARSHPSKYEVSSEILLKEIPDSFGLDPLAKLEQDGAVELARRWIQDCLDETERTVLTLHIHDEMPLDAITRLLGLRNASGAKAYIVSARRKLQEAARRWKARHEAAR